MSVWRGEVYGHRYVVPLPVGAEGLALFGAVGRVLDRVGYFDGGDAKTAAGRHMAELRSLMLLASAPGGRDVVVQTLGGPLGQSGEVDGLRIHPGVWEALWATPGRFLEPYIAALRVWEAAGFFGAVSNSAPEAAESDSPETDAASD